MGVEGRELDGREAAFVHGRPETVARACEMVADGRGVEAGVDADEEDVEIGADEVGDGFGVGILELLFGRFPGLGHGGAHCRRIRHEDSKANSCWNAALGGPDMVN